MKLITYVLVAISLVLVACKEKKTSEPPAPVLQQATLEISPRSLAMLVGESKQLSYTYTNTSGVHETVPVTWTTSSTTIATIDATGKISASMAGQVKVFVQGQGLKDSINVNIVSSDTSIARVTLSFEFKELSKGEIFTVTAKAFTINNTEITGKKVYWATNNDQIVTIDENGVITGVGFGLTQISACIAGVFSADVPVSVYRKATFVGAEGHSAMGGVRLLVENGTLKIRTESNFSVQGGPDLRMYLSNVASGGGVASTGLELSLLTANSGVTSYNVPSTVGINDYKYIVVHCKKFSTSFGTAQLD